MAFPADGIFIRTLRLKNYLCFADTGVLAFDAGINVITGPNNIGKTALLAGLSLTPGTSQRHVSIKSRPSPSDEPAEARIEFTFEAGPAVLRGVDQHNLALPFSETVNPQSVLADVVAQLRQGRLYYAAEMTDTWSAVHPFGAPFQWLIPVRQGDEVHDQGQRQGGQFVQQSLGVSLANAYRSRVFVFNAERYKTGACAQGGNTVLQPDASNLPEVLGVMQANHRRFRDYNRLVRRVLPSVSQVSVRPTGGNTVAVLVWKGDEDSDRIDLATPLANCGSGVGQVLAMLYVVSESPYPRTILIDEPNSFLHPGAVAALLEIFHEHPHHQYIITTHSPGVIADSRPATLHLLKSRGEETVVSQLHHADLEAQREVLTAVGAKLTDVFGPEKIMWVEGPSEAAVFPLIARHRNVPIARVAFLPLTATSDLQAKHAKLAAEIYQRMSAGIALLPPACAFVLDREGRTETELERMSSLAPGKVHFLKRRMLENYLLHPRAVAELLVSWGINTDESTVSAWYEHHGAVEYSSKAEPLSADWLREVDAAKLLSATTRSLAQHHHFDKVRDTPVLTRWLLDNAPQELDDLGTLLVSVLK